LRILNIDRTLNNQLSTKSKKSDNFAAKLDFTKGNLFQEYSSTLASHFFVNLETFSRN
jgi:hypothetical protein